MQSRLEICAKTALCVGLFTLASCSKSPTLDGHSTDAGRATEAARIAASQKAIEDKVDCSKDDLANMDMIVCNSIKVRKAEAELDQYLQASRASLIEEIAITKEFDPGSDADKALADFDGAQRDWKNFVRQKCRSESAYFGGSNAPNENLRCYMTETKYRTLMLWQNWLTYADSTPPKWPRPQFDFSYIEWDGVNR